MISSSTKKTSSSSSLLSSNGSQDHHHHQQQQQQLQQDIMLPPLLPQQEQMSLVGLMERANYSRKNIAELQTPAPSRPSPSLLSNHKKSNASLQSILTEVMNLMDDDDNLFAGDDDNNMVF